MTIPHSNGKLKGLYYAEGAKSRLNFGFEGKLQYLLGQPGNGGNRGRKVDLVFSPDESRVVLAKCKASATVTPAMTAPMRRLAAAFGRGGLKIAMNLVHNPPNAGRDAPTAGKGIVALSCSAFIDSLFANWRTRMQTV